MKNLLPFYILLPALLTGCSIAQQQPSSEAAIATAEPTEEPIIYVPGELNQESLFDLLVAELAGQRRLFPLAMNNYMKQAEKTRDAGVAERAARIAQYLNNSDTLIRASRLWRDIDPDNPEPYQLEAGALLHQNRFAEALPLLDQALAYDGNSLLALLRRQANRLTDPLLHSYIQKLEQHPQQEQGNPELLITLAALYNLAGDFINAERNYDRILSEEPDNTEALVQKAELLHNQGASQRSLQLVEQAYEKQPDNRQLHLLYIQLLFGVDRNQDAVSQARDLRLQHPDDHKLTYYLALLMLENQQLDASGDTLRALLQAQPDDSSPHYYLGYIYQQQGATTAAIDHYLQVKHGNNIFQALSRASALLPEPEQRPRIQTMLEQARIDHPELAPQLYSLEAEWLSQSGFGPDAIEVLNHAISEFNDNPDLLYSRAMLIEAENFTQAEADLRQILQSDPDNAMALNALGYTLTLHTTRYQEAYDLISKALRQKPEDAAILDSMGWVLFLLNKVPEAIPYLEHAYDRHPDPEVASHLIRAYWSNQQRDNARNLLLDALSKDPENHYLLEAQDVINSES